MLKTKQKQTTKKVVQFEVEKLPHKIEFNLGQQVYLKTDEDQSPRIVTGIQLRPNGGVIYSVSRGSEIESEHYAIELSAERDVLLVTGVI
jgi:hypothetical protein